MIITPIDGFICGMFKSEITQGINNSNQFKVMKATKIKRYQIHY